MKPRRALKLFFEPKLDLRVPLRVPRVLEASRGSVRVPEALEILREVRRNSGSRERKAEVALEMCPCSKVRRKALSQRKAACPAGHLGFQLHLGFEVFDKASASRTENRAQATHSVTRAGAGTVCHRRRAPTDYLQDVGESIRCLARRCSGVATADLVQPIVGFAF